MYDPLSTLMISTSNSPTKVTNCENDGTVYALVTVINKRTRFLSDYLLYLTASSCYFPLTDKVFRNLININSAYVQKHVLVIVLMLFNYASFALLGR